MDLLSSSQSSLDHGYLWNKVKAMWAYLKVVPDLFDIIVESAGLNDLFLWFTKSKASTTDRAQLGLLLDDWAEELLLLLHGIIVMQGYFLVVDTLITFSVELRWLSRWVRHGELEHLRMIVDKVLDQESLKFESISKFRVKTSFLSQKIWKNNGSIKMPLTLPEQGGPQMTRAFRYWSFLPLSFISIRFSSYLAVPIILRGKLG